MQLTQQQANQLVEEFDHTLCDWNIVPVFDFEDYEELGYGTAKFELWGHDLEIPIHFSDEELFVGYRDEGLRGPLVPRSIWMIIAGKFCDMVPEQK